MGIKTSKNNTKNCRRQKIPLEERSSTILRSIEQIIGFNKLNMMHWKKQSSKAIYRKCLV